MVLVVAVVVAVERVFPDESIIGKLRTLRRAGGRETRGRDAICLVSLS